MDALEIAKRLNIKHNVTIRVIDEATNEVVQEHVGHNAATNSMLTGIAHYLLGDGTLNQGSDMLTTWVPQYISLGTMGLTSQESESIYDDEDDHYEYIVPAALGTTLPAPSSATAEEKELNAQLRFTEYLNECPGFGADGYDDNNNNNRIYFGLGLPYDERPALKKQDFFSGNGISREFTLSSTPTKIVSVTVYPDGVVNQDTHDKSITNSVVPSDRYTLNNDTVILTGDITNVIPPPDGSRIAIIYEVEGDEAAVCELIDSDTTRSKISYRGLIPEVQSEIPGTMDIIFSAFVSNGQLAKYRGDKDYIYITEAGLWSKPSYSGGGDNGLLAGYRILPSDDIIAPILVTDKFQSDGDTYKFELHNYATEISSITCGDEVIDPRYYTIIHENGQSWLVFLIDEQFHPPVGELIVIYQYEDDTWKDMSVPENRRLVQKSIIRIGPGQVAQIVWKLQLGGLEQLDGLRYLYPSQYPEDVWIVWNS